MTFEERLNGAVFIPRQKLANGEEINDMLVCPVSGIVLFEPKPEWAVCKHDGWNYGSGSQSQILKTPAFSH